MRSVHALISRSRQDEAEVNKALNAPRPKDKSDVDTDLPQESLNLLHTELCRNLDAMADKFESEDPVRFIPLQFISSRGDADLVLFDLNRTQVCPFSSGC